MKKIKWPNNKKFAFTIVDDTDGAFLDNIKPVYDYLNNKGLKTTKTIWIFKPKNHYTGDYLLNHDSAYFNYLVFLKSNGFEIAFHNSGSGSFLRPETIKGLHIFKEVFGSYPKMHINHSNNEDNIYWGKERFNGLVKFLYCLSKNRKTESLGSNPDSDYFWGDYSKKYIKYIRNRTFNCINTLKVDKQLVRKEKGKTKYANYWFSASDAMNIKMFKSNVTKRAINSLERNGGCCILYTHFAYNFVKENGELDSYFREMIDYISKKNGWFVPCSEILDYVLSYRENNRAASKTKLAFLDIKWLLGRLVKRIKTKN